MPALDAGHAAHRSCVRSVRELRPALSGHAAFEVHSVLTRMPGGLAVDAPSAAQLMTRVFPEPLFLDGAASAALLRRLGTLGLVGGQVYDALVAEATRVHGRTLLTRDRRAMPVYDLIGVTHRLVED